MQWHTKCNAKLLPLVDICSIKLLNKHYEEFIETDFMLENYIHSKVNDEIIKKHGKHS